MPSFLADLWNDLRAKRLWPVAVLLVAGLVAVPLVLSKDPQAPPAPPPAESTSDARERPEPSGLEDLASVSLEDVDAADGSSLDTFDPSDPFRPPTDVLEEAEEEASGATDAGPSGEPTGATDADGAGGSSGASGSSDETSTSGDGGSDGGTGGTDGSDDGSEDGDGDAPPTTTQYAYVIDVTFSANGRRRRIRGMERLDMLPSRRSPLLLFLGVSANAGNAVFLVDSTLDAAGEGSCKPSRSECAFLYLGAGSEHAFTDDEGRSYELRVDEIRKVRLGATASSSRRGASTRARAGSAGRRRFAAPPLADLVTVSRHTPAASGNRRPRR